MVVLTLSKTLAQYFREGDSTLAVRMEAITIKEIAAIQLRRPIKEFNAFSLRNLAEACIDGPEVLVRSWKPFTVHRQKSEHKHARSHRS